MDHTREAAALLTLLRQRPHGASWSGLAAEVALEGSAISVLARMIDDGSLFPPQVTDQLLSDAAGELRSWQMQDLHVVSILDDAFPRRLLDIRELPPFLFYKGDLRADDEGMSIVGSRAASAWAIQIASEVATFLVTENISVISGLAEGVDAAAHTAALSAGGRTVAVLGTGISRSYPAKNAGLQQEIAERGLVLSQFFPDAAPSKQSFPMRNATMSGYGTGTIVIEASELSGTRIQARKAGEHGRPVILTSRVVDMTEWGKSLVGRPNVVVASSLGDLKEAVREVRAVPSRLRAALASLASS